MFIHPRFSISSRGFTMIELVATVVLIGVLSSVAMPRFISLSESAQIGVIDATRSAIDQGAQQIYYKSLMQGKQGLASGTIALGTTNVPIAFGFPKAFDGIVPSVNIGDVDYYGRNRDNRVNDWVYQLRRFGGRDAIDIARGELVGDQPAPTPESTGCFIRYHQATASEKALVEGFTGGC